MGEIQHILLITQKVVDKFLRNVSFSETGCLTNNKSFDFGADPDNDPDPGNF